MKKLVFEDRRVKVIRWESGEISLDVLGNYGVTPRELTERLDAAVKSHELRLLELRELRDFVAVLEREASA